MADPCLDVRRRLVDSPRPDEGLHRFMHGVAVLLPNQSIGGISMALNGIDISNWQAGIDLSAVPCDFVISKATEGCWYVSADCARQVEQALSLGKCVGVYHYANGGNAVSEADYFVNNCANWVGKVVWCLDWEQQGNGLAGSGASAQQWIRLFLRPRVRAYRLPAYRLRGSVHA